MLRIRKEQPRDIEGIRQVNLRAFGQTQEADIVDRLRQNCSGLLSLVAIIENRVVGHILFSPAFITCEKRTVYGMGLAPLGVMPEYQRQGVGSRLVRHGIAILKKQQCPFIIVLGHPQYYPRFDFEHAIERGIGCEWDVPDEAFMILVLDESTMQSVTGVAKYRPEFAEAL